MSTNKDLLVNTELVKVVKMLQERGLKVVSTNCIIHIAYQHPQIPKIIYMQIELGDHYPEAMFLGLPHPWMLYEYCTSGSGVISEYVYSGLSSSQQHPEATTDKEIEEAKRLLINSMEEWLENIDPDGFKAVWTLAGYDLGQIKLWR